MSNDDTGFGGMSMFELFQMEEQQQSALITENLLNLENNPKSQKYLEALMRASHSLKGAARMVGVNPVVDIAHIMEDCFVAAQNDKLILNPDHIDILLKSKDIISQIANASQNVNDWVDANKYQLEGIKNDLKSILSSEESDSDYNNKYSTFNADRSLDLTDDGIQDENEDTQLVVEHSNLRIDSAQIDRLMRLAGEASEGARWIRKFSESMLKLKRNQVDLVALIDRMAEKIKSEPYDEKMLGMIHEVQAKASGCRSIICDKLSSLDGFERNSISVSKRLSQAVITSRMQPFGDGIGGFPRLVRDVSRKLGKNVKFEIEGKRTLVDREILAKIEAPLNHLLRNAIDHGIESPSMRMELGKAATGLIKISAYHMSGMLFITVIDDGQGVDIDRLREKAINKGMINGDMPKMLTGDELLEFIFLPSFSTRDEVTEISGRGVGLDVVHDSVKEMGGVIRTFSTYGKGTTFQLQLPLTLSVIPSLLVKIEDEPYAFALSRIDSIHTIDVSEVEVVDGHQFINIDGRNIGLISAAQILNLTVTNMTNDVFSVVIISDRSLSYGIVVDKCFGEQNLVVQKLPKIIGKIKDISAAAILENGLPVFIVDIDDMLRSVEKLASSGLITDIEKSKNKINLSDKKKILVVDDSITVREVERNMLEAIGYDVSVAVDGMDGWHMIRQYNYDLIVSDIDMPRMDGIELISKIKSKNSYKNIPIIVVSYKDRDADRDKVFNAGADCYLTKGSFQDNSLRDAVADLIGSSTI